MKDIPVFATEYGAASLTLREIPYREAAFVRLQATQQPQELISECVGFCRAVGAQAVYATGHSYLEGVAPVTSVIGMACSASSLPQTDAALFPVQAQTLDRWRAIYNEKIRTLPTARYMDDADAKELLSCGEGYFVHRGDTLLGIGRISGNTLRFVAATEQGAGADVVCALAGAVFDDTVKLEVAGDNEKAVALYSRLGFVPCGEVCRWYRVFPEK